MEERRNFGEEELEISEESVTDLEPEQSESEKVAGGNKAEGYTECIDPSVLHTSPNIMC